MKPKVYPLGNADHKIAEGTNKGAKQANLRLNYHVLLSKYRKSRQQLND